MFPDWAAKKYPLVGELETFKFASSTTLSAIVKAPLPVTSPECVAFVVLAVLAEIAEFTALAILSAVTASFAISASAIVPSVIFAVVTALAANLSVLTTPSSISEEVTILFAGVEPI